MPCRSKLFVAGLLTMFFIPSGSIFAEVVCGKLTLKNGKPKLTIQNVAALPCPKKFVQIVDTSLLATQGAPGVNGTDGQPGQDGSIRVYGDGSAGNFVVNSTQNWPSTVAQMPTNLQFADFTIDAGVTLTIPSGMVIRCSGTFTNNGVINVSAAARGGDAGTGFNSPDVMDRSFGLAHPGVSLRAAQNGSHVINSATATGGGGGLGLGTAAARQLIMPGLFGGGGGGSSIGAASAGGGSLVVLAKDGIVNAGTINANGGSSSGTPGVNDGGGGGGVVIFASQIGIDNTGSISARGGDGAPSSTEQGGSGGGGGGIVHMIAPAVSQGVVDVSGGAGGLLTTAITSANHTGGGGGGACAGSGGGGAQINSNNTFGSSPGSGGLGEAFVTNADPTSLF